MENEGVMNVNTFQIGTFTVGGSHTFVIAEIGNNHNGSMALAKELVDRSIEAGADCVKFQIRNNAALYRKAPGEEGSEDLGVEYVQDLLKRVELTLDEHREVRAYCKQKNILYMCTPWDEPSVDVLASFDVSAVKMASADIINPYLMRKAATLGKPIIMSTGMSLEHEIERAVAVGKALGVPFALLHCNSAYPAPEGDIHLGYIRRLKELHSVIGYSGHERGTAISVAAVALGAVIIERHISLDRNMEGPDHPASLEPGEFKSLVDGIRQVEQALPWTGPGRILGQGEMLNRENLSKSVIAARAVPVGEVFSEDNLRIASPGQGLAPYRLPELLGKTAVRNLRDGDFLYPSDVEGTVSVKRHYKFPVLWGVPVRYHDFKNYHEWVEPDLFEFHLSYRDLSLKPVDYLTHVPCKRLVVHAPELFENSELLDIVSDDLSCRQRSIDNLKRVVDVTEQLRVFFPKADSALIVANIGGFSMDTPFDVAHRKVLYQRFSESCAKIDFGSTELTPQNMAPFPWHFGGQRHQNIFMMPDELAEQAEQMKLRYCLDLSHLQMACSHFKLNFQSALSLLLPYSIHLHVADALGVNGEGVLMGTGDISWPETWKKICVYPNTSFIPEVWQGHKDHGAGFWTALDYLTKLS
jgi:N-acetylneuraminate synthase